MSRLNDATLAVAVVPGQDAIREMFSLGVNFVIYKPVAYERALSSLRAARAVMRKEKRKNARATVHAQATVDYANVQQEKATLMDLAQDGMAVRFGKKLPPTSKVYFEFRLPPQSSSIRLSGQVVWQDWNGCAGVQFVDVPKTSRRLLTEFLSANLPAEHDHEHDQFSDVTVEVEEPLQLATVSVAEQTHGERGEPQHAKHGEAVPVHLPRRPLRRHRTRPTTGACRFVTPAAWRRGVSNRNVRSQSLLPDGSECGWMLSRGPAPVPPRFVGRDPGAHL